MGAASPAARSRAAGALLPPQHRARRGEQLPRRLGRGALASESPPAPSEYGPAVPGEAGERRAPAGARWQGVLSGGVFLGGGGMGAVFPGKPRSTPAVPKRILRGRGSPV